jgi:hypothetical protein
MTKITKFDIERIWQELDELALEIGARTHTKEYGKEAHNDLIKLVEEYQSANRAYTQILDGIFEKYYHWFKQ